jgi:ATP-dependent Lon protease
VELEETVRYKPYRVQRIRPLETPPSNDVIVDALLAKVRELLEERVHLGLSFLPVAPKAKNIKPPPGFSPKEILEYLDKLSDPEHVADLVSCAVLAGGVERQTILATVNLESRLKHLIHFLMAEINQQRKDKER